MIKKFKDAEISDKNGNKANSLIAMRAAGFNVPDGFVLDSDCFDKFLKDNSLINEIRKDIASEKKGPSTKTLSKFDRGSFSKDISEKIKELTKPRKLYAVRSSCTKEDLGELSFAGQYQTFLFVSPEEIEAKIIACYKATYNDNIVAYCEKNHIELGDLKMSVVVQEMVDSDYSGICFTVNPTTGDDKTMLVEMAPGIGENIVSGHNAPEQYLYNWYDETTDFEASNKILDEKRLRQIGETFSRIQQHFGFPCDIEFAIKDGELYILQARKITKIVYGGYKDVWTTADFKDGGVSATVCTPFMWSLYEYIWDSSLVKFILDSNILTQKELEGHVPGEMYFGRPYWNLSVVKMAMSKVVGYREREFDNEYGIKGKYEGDGVVTKFSPKNIVALARMAIGQKKIVSEREKNAENLKQDLLNRYTNYRENYNPESRELAKTWRHLVEDDYLFSETTYFWQIFINTIHQSLYKDSLLKNLAEDEYLTVLGGIKDISHMRPFYEMWRISRSIRADKKALSYWKETDPEQILKKYNRNHNAFSELEQLVEDYGYHSDKELDVTYECYFENPLPYIINIKNMCALEDAFGPEHDQLHNEHRYHEILDRIEKEVGERKYRKIRAKILKMRKMLWWREEFRDLSTRFYYIIHIYSKAYGEQLARKKILAHPDDIWMLKIRDIWDYQDKRKTASDLRNIVLRNRKYYNCYRNYMSDNEIVPGDSSQKSVAKGQLVGLGACGGKVTATARVIRDFSEIERLQKGDILITKFTDTGWTPKFAILSGIVTEFGGILCHAAIVSREYGIPAIVNCHDAMEKIADGQTITIDGSTGEIELGE